MSETETRWGVRMHYCADKWFEARDGRSSEDLARDHLGEPGLRGVLLRRTTTVEVVEEWVGWTKADPADWEPLPADKIALDRRLEANARMRAQGMAGVHADTTVIA